MTEAKDQVARQTAALAKQKIEDHEDHCAERWGEARSELRSLRDETKLLHGRVSETNRAMNAFARRALWVFIAGQGSVILLLVAELIAARL